MNNVRKDGTKWKSIGSLMFRDNFFYIFWSLVVICATCLILFFMQSQRIYDDKINSISRNEFRIILPCGERHTFKRDEVLKEN